MTHTCSSVVLLQPDCSRESVAELKGKIVHCMKEGVDLVIVPADTLEVWHDRTECGCGVPCGVLLVWKQVNMSHF